MKKIGKVLGYIILGIIGFCVLYLVAEYCLSRLSASSKEVSTDQTIQVFVKSNGVHTDIVLPVVMKELDWSNVFPYANTVGKKTGYQYMGIGWGIRGFIWIHQSGKILKHLRLL
jgi:hypothetical protein